MLCSLSFCLSFSPTTEKRIDIKLEPKHIKSPDRFHTTFGSNPRAPKPDAPQDLKAALQAVVDKHASFWNVSVTAAIYNDSLDLAVASGTDDYTSGKPFTTDLRVPMGSTTKMYTAVSVLRLSEEGKLQLDDPLQPHIDAYLAQERPCSELSDFCSTSCLPIAHCLFDPTATGCSSVPASVGPTCLGYCTHYLHCATPALPGPLTLQLLWSNASTIKKVTWREVIGMTSGVMDYYYDSTNWLYNTVMDGTRDVEPLEYLSHQNHSFLFAPGASGRAAYSTNGFSLVGLALAGLLGLSDWADLDQRALAWGAQLPADDATMFGTRGTCLSYSSLAKQYASTPSKLEYVEISNHSCLNSWLGGNIAARARDIARFVHAVFHPLASDPATATEATTTEAAAAGGVRLLSDASLKAMTSFHEITDGFAAGYLAYGLGLEGLWDRGSSVGRPLSACGLASFGHGGLDYGSGAPINAYFPSLKLGVSIAFTSCMSYGSTVAGKNCSLSYASQVKVQDYAVNDVLALLSTAAGLTPQCAAPSYVPQPPSQCVDAPYFGKMSSILGKHEVSCTEILTSASASSHLTPGELCDQWLAHTTIAGIEQQLKAQAYEPPPGYNASTTFAVDLCKHTCGALGAGPCWLNGKPTPWC